MCIRDRFQGTHGGDSSGIVETTNRVESAHGSHFEELGGDQHMKSFTVDELVDIEDGDRGKNYPKSYDFQDHGYCLLLNTGNVTKEGFYFEETQFISEIKDKQLRKGKLKRGDIIYTTCLLYTSRCV